MILRSFILQAILVLLFMLQWKQITVFYLVFWVLPYFSTPSSWSHGNINITTVKWWKQKKIISLPMFIQQRYWYQERWVSRELAYSYAEGLTINASPYNCNILACVYLTILSVPKLFLSLSRIYCLWLFHHKVQFLSLKNVWFPSFLKETIFVGYKF